MSKYLDKEDIESLDWILNDNSNIYHKDKYSLMFLGTKIRIWHETSNVGFSDTIFEGTIDTKSELKVLLKQLGI